MDFAPRVPWPPDFPDVFVHTTVKLRDGHPDYAAAKSGRADAALRLAADIMDGAVIRELGAFCSEDARLLPVSAKESTGFNGIPDAMAAILSRTLGIPADRDQVVQTNVVSHTRADGWHRLSSPATFDGAVQPDCAYILVDDHVGLGGTLANLRGYVETRGGRVVAATTLTKSRDSDRLALRRETHDALHARFGGDLDDFWREIFGHGLDCLTEPEAGYLLRSDGLDRIRDRLAPGEEAGSA
ncbi:hypothetical protein [Rhodospirillum centenum]|uniref:Protein TraN n=1 Tax=Rhodospirillum centenum (strain ATCC 51521 / SW) TaxID=414684 RepID=B6IWQ3_RHOCS|nr:hypothetical protein [Rhodospirillum centenum]ACJ00727.1 protein TraN [Rhodospirillum centenum SW]